MCPSPIQIFHLKQLPQIYPILIFTLLLFPRVSNLCPLLSSFSSKAAVCPILSYFFFNIYLSHLSRQHFITYPKLYTHWQTSVRDMCPPRRLEIQHTPDTSETFCVFLKKTRRNRHPKFAGCVVLTSSSCNLGVKI